MYSRAVTAAHLQAKRDDPERSTGIGGKAVGTAVQH